MPIRLAIVDDYEVVIRGLAEMLADHSDQLEVVELAAQLPVVEPVDIALYDTFAQTQGDGPDVGELLANPAVRHVVVYTWNVEEPLVRQTLARGVSGYLSKALSTAELVEALKQVHAGEQVVAPLPVPETARVENDYPGRAEGLTVREAEVIALITQGLSNAEIASRASLSINSVKSYIRSSYRKMGVASRTNAVLWGLEHGFVPDRMRARAGD
ncbi:MAG TPA: response regulator transcription factor [Marmoricola sp.]|nr:response regulator transcription factor [Marmoricola sp.]